MSLTSLWVRFRFKKSDKKRDAGLTFPEDVVRTENLSYGPYKENVLDVYRPRVGATKLPVIVSVHGGGWVYGDKELYKHYCLSLAQRGFVVVNFTYRLSPEYKFPCHLEDTAKVFEWVHKHGARHGMDRDHVFAVGDSAGAHILSLFCLMCTNPSYAAKYSFSVPENYLPKAISLNCGVYNVESEKQNGSNTISLMKDVLPKRGTQEELHMISPVNFINEKFPPCFIMTSNEDFLKDQPEELKRKLDMFGVPYIYRYYGDERHKLGHVFHLDMRNSVGKICNDEQCEYFKGFVKEEY